LETKEAPMRKQPEISAIEAHLGYWLRFVSNHVSHAFSLKVATYNVVKECLTS
jgi:hypothetical protein